MNKALILMMITLCLVGCGDKSYTDDSENYKLPPELSACKVYYLGQGGLQTGITVVHCPRADTTTSYTQSCGKGCTRHINTTVASY